MERSVSTSSSQSARFETFTEAVPLSLSSMAHASLPLDEGVLDGLRQVLSHTLLSCVNYARIMHPPHMWTFRDLTTSESAWTTVKEEGEGLQSELPFSLQKLAFKHHYSRNALIYLQPALPTGLTASEELEKMKDWMHQVGILGRVTLRYASTEPLTRGEMDGTDTDDMPPTILYKVVVEYRSLPATGSQQAVQAEELSMLSFGGSVDDDVKYGALASLYDKHAKYVLEIYSVRGKKYKFDLMDSTLSDGTVPSLPSSRDGDPFVKSLCVTVTDHSTYAGKNDGNAKYAITRINLTLEGKPRLPFDQLPNFNYVTDGIKASFLLLNPEPVNTVTASPSGHTLLLDPALSGRVYVNGRYVTTWGKDSRIGSHGVALFGMDLLSIPFWHGQIVDYEAMKVAYAQLWHEILIDARLQDLNIANILLYRLMTGHDPDVDEDDLYDDDEAVGIDVDCLESQVLAASQYDRVGIAPKALATRFSIEFGRLAFPCLSYEIDSVKRLLPGRQPVEVPQRLISVLRRGGYFDVQKTSDDLWFTHTRQPRELEERDVVQTAIQLLEAADCNDVQLHNVAFTSIDVQVEEQSRSAVCRYQESSHLFAINEHFIGAIGDDESRTGDDSVDRQRMKALFLGLHIALEHPDGSVLTRYFLKNMVAGRKS